MLDADDAICVLFKSNAYKIKFWTEKKNNSKNKKYRKEQLKPFYYPKKQIKSNTCPYNQRTPPLVGVPPLTLNVSHPITFTHATTSIRRVSAMITLLPSISASRHHSRQLNENSTLSALNLFFSFIQLLFYLLFQFQARNFTCGFAITCG